MPCIDCLGDSRSAQFLCFQDADDVMHPERLAMQLAEAQANSDSIVGCHFDRIPADATPRYTMYVTDRPTDRPRHHCNNN
jgi:hypothetical protein